MFNCKECGATFIPVQNNQLFCSASHRVKNCADKKRKEALINASNANNEELERLKNENTTLQEQNDHWKDVIRRHHKQLDDQAATIEKLENDLERLRKEKVVMNRPQTMLNREHLQDVLNKELRRQFPKDPEIQAHIGAIRAFNASYINALVTT
jgi:predicted nuclease with TOPRIM domain